MSWRATAGALLELTKPRITRMVAVTALLGAIAAPGPVPWLAVVPALFGTALVVAAANALNMYLERDSDALMARTKERPLPSGRLSADAALPFAAVLAVFGLATLVLLSNTRAASLAIAALAFYVVLYTPLKRVTSLSLEVGAVPGALPPVIGWAAATGGTLDVGAWSLFAILFCWQLPHFHAIALVRREDYARAGVVVLPNVIGASRVRARMLWQSVLLLAVSVAPYWLGVSSALYAWIAGACGVVFLGVVLSGVRERDEDRSRRWARRVFFASLPYLVVVYVAFCATVLR